MRPLVLAAFLPALLLLGCSSEPEPPSSPSPKPPRTGEVSDFYTVPPCQILDTRTGAPLTAGSERTFQIAGGKCGIPKGAQSVAANVITAGTEGRGLLVLRSDADRGALELGYEKAIPRATHLLLPLSPDGSITAAVQGPGGAHFQLVVSGYFLASPTPPG